MFVISALLAVWMGRIDVLLAKCPQGRHPAHGVEVHTHLEGGRASLVSDQGAGGVIRPVGVILPGLVNVVVIHEIILVLVSVLVIGRGVILVIAGFAAIARLLIRLILVGAVIRVLTTRAVKETRFLTRLLIR